MSFDKLIERIIELKNPTVVGLDPRLEYVPEFIQRRYLDKDGWTLKAAAKAIFDFNQAIIDEIHDVVPAIKPQAAYYEKKTGRKIPERCIRDVTPYEWVSGDGEMEPYMTICKTGDLEGTLLRFRGHQFDMFET